MIPLALPRSRPVHRVANTTLVVIVALDRKRMPEK